MGFCWPSLYTTSDDIALCFSNWGWLIQMVAITAETHVDMIRSQFGKVIIENVGFNIKSNWERQFYYDRPKITFPHILFQIFGKIIKFDRRKQSNVNIFLKQTSLKHIVKWAGSACIVPVYRLYDKPKTSAMVIIIRYILYSY